MDKTEIISYLMDNASLIIGPVQNVASALIAVIFLRHKTDTTEFEKIKMGQFKEVTDKLLEAGKMTYTEYYKAKNFLSIAQKADKYYSEMKSNNKVEYDFDWFFRFYEASGNVSNEDMQELWAKILAGELAQPSTFSLRTVDILRNMSKNDAELFKRICSHSFNSKKQTTNISRAFLPYDTEYLEKKGVTYEDIMKMSELGLIYMNSSIGITVPTSEIPRNLMINNDLVMTIASSTIDDFRVIKQYVYTEAGTELAFIISENASDDEFIDYGKQLAEEHSDCDIAIYRIIGYKENEVEHDDINLLAN